MALCQGQESEGDIKICGSINDRGCTGSGCVETKDPPGVTAKKAAKTRTTTATVLSDTKILKELVEVLQRPACRNKLMKSPPEEESPAAASDGGIKPPPDPPHPPNPPVGGLEELEADRDRLVVDKATQVNAPTLAAVPMLTSAAKTKQRPHSFGRGGHQWTQNEWLHQIWK